MGIKKLASLKTAFWEFLLMLLGGLFVAVSIPLLLLDVSTTLGLSTYGNYSEIKANELAPIIAATPRLSEVQIPMGIKYALLNENYQLIETTLDEAELEQAIRYVTSGVNDQNLQKQYLLVTRDNEYVILQYYVGAQFTNEWMNQHLPSPDILLMILIAVGGIFVCMFLTARFAKKLQLQLAPLFEATLQVAQQNLDFEIGHSTIKEFEDVLLSFSNMKEHLKNSLKQQWESEQMQKEQIAALAHDLKTPLTVIQGNIDLLTETPLDTEQINYAKYISDSSEQMQAYIKMLIDISRTTAGYQIRKEKLQIMNFMLSMKMQIESLCQTKGVHLKMNITSENLQMKADPMLLERALMNVVSNALDYSPENGIIYVDAYYEHERVQFTVTDEGCGFSIEALQHAKERFYMEDRSRSTKAHSGMGLYIASSIMQQHGGRLVLGNSTDTNGAKVILEIPAESLDGFPTFN